MARPEKIAAVEAIKGDLDAAQCLVLADYTGLTVEQMTIFRADCRKEEIKCRVVKNRLARIAADNADLQEIKECLTGPTAMILSESCQVGPAKIVVDFAEKNEAMKIKGGFVGGGFITADEVVSLSKVPSHDELIAKMMGSINSPASGIVGTINGVMASLARVISAAKSDEAA